MKSLFSLCFFIVAPFVLQANHDHDIHVSMSEVRWNEESSSFEVSIKLFIDDFETALAKQNLTGLNIGTEKESANANQAITDYLEKHFRITLDGANLDAQFLGKETTEDYKAIWCYVEFPGTKNPKQCRMYNDLLFEVYDDQRSIMDIRMNSTHKAYTILEPGKNTWSYTF
jgi:hypothetical protein